MKIKCNVSIVWYWRAGSDDFLRGYRYSYDALNRLTEATYEKNGANTRHYDENISYDPNGNIQGLYRSGNSEAFEQPLDQLAYSYHPVKRNQLAKVFDSTNESLGFDDDSPDGINDPEDDYAYDDNGNMTSDQNKNITLITYNHLNLPVQINFGYAQKIEYLYDALGTKKRKSVTANEPGTLNPKTENIDYMGGYQYKKGELQFFPTAEGYVRNTQGVLNHVFQYRDHLGNIRLSYAEDPAFPGTLRVIEENHYYPFGLQHTNYNSDQMVFAKGETGVFLKDKPCALCPEPVMPLWNNYKYNGKEFQDELGLNLYDYGARNYDPAIGRWMNIDPLAEQGRRWSPYNYAMDNPVFFLDPDGMLSESFINDFWNKSGNGTTKWTNNDNGSFSSNTGETISDGEGDPPQKGTSKTRQEKKDANAGGLLKKRKDGDSEILSKFNPFSDFDKGGIERFVNSEFEQNVLKWYAHGSVNGTGGGMTASEFSVYLYENSDIFKNAKDNQQLLVVKLFTCDTGQIEGPGGFAYEMSKLNPNMIFWAPTNHLVMGKNSIRNKESGHQEYMNVYQNGRIIERRVFKN